MTKKKYISPVLAAKKAGCHHHTMRRWIRLALDGLESPVSDVRRTGSGRLFVAESCVPLLKEVDE